MSGGIDKLREQLAELAANKASMAYEMWKLGMESPIERVLFIGMFSLIDSDEWEFAPLARVEIIDGDGSDPHPTVLARIEEKGTLLIHLQHRLLDWRADFVLSCPSISDKKVIIECDGHDFHERTKEQAARDRGRDRAAQAAGYMMLRYTGSEIYRDPLKCARSALKALADLIYDDWVPTAGDK
jgi:very-short-patch-repair endonuclease